MYSKADLTKDKILINARKEFLEVGFHKASMRKIASLAQVTTGAIYRYYPDKEALFMAATEDAVTALHSIYGDMTEVALKDISEGKRYNPEVSLTNLSQLFDLVYEYFDQFYLLVVCSEESVKEGFIHQIVEEETASTREYLKRLKEYYHSAYDIDETTLHILIEAFVSALLEPIRHRMGKEEAMKHIEVMGEFFTDGWAGIEKKICGTPQ